MIFKKKRGSIAHLWYILLCLAISLCVETATGHTNKPHYSVSTRQQFKLNKTIFVTGDFERRNVTTEFAKWLRSQGIAASNAYNKAPNRITFVKVNSIEGTSGDDAWQISVKSKRITVSFTTNTALQNTLTTLQNMVQESTIRLKYIPGGVISDWGARVATKAKETTADMASSLQSLNNLEATLKKLGGKSKEIYLILVSADKWRMESPSLELAGLTKMLYPSDGYYNLQQLQEIAKVARKNHIEIIPTLELCSENRAFTTAFGHSIFSVEGMRLVRVAIEDCIDILNPTRICLGTMSPQADMRYLKFISDLAEMLSVELVIIEA